MKRLRFVLFYAVFLSFTLIALKNFSFANPLITIDQPMSGTVFEIQSDVRLSGSATPNSDIFINTQDGEYAKLRSDNEGRWSFIIPTVSEGSHTIEVKIVQKVDSLSEKSAAAYLTYVVSPPPPSGVARLAETGITAYVAIPFGFVLLVITVWLYIDYRRHKKPLKALDPKVKYSFWHHLHVVSLPLLKYRLSINLDKRIPDRSAHIRRY